MNNNIIIIGAGNMGRAIAKGLLNNPKNIIYFKTLSDTVIDDTDFECDIQKSRVFFNSEHNFFYNIHNPWIILAVKPHHILSVIHDITDIITHTNPQAMISLAAGVTLNTLQTACPPDIPIIRTMPNISVAMGNGVIGYISNTQAIQHDFIDLCTPLGLLYAIDDEQEFHLFTAIAGSGPAFFLHTIEAMAQAAHKLGMDYMQAEKIATHVFSGVASVLQTNTPTHLRHSVTSPNGTTQAGLEVLMNHNLSVSESHLTELLTKTLLASQKRSQNME